MSFLLRVILPDEPGNLGAVASALGGAGADILSIDVVERSAGQAIDDIAVELSSHRPPDVLITAAESVPGVTVESVRPHTGQLDTHRELELLDQIAGDPGHGLDLLAAEVPRLFRAGWALVAVSEHGRSFRIAESAAAPETRTGDLPWLPLDRAIALDDSHWVPEPWRAMDTELAAAPFGTGVPPKTLVVGRPGGPVFRLSELARLAHLAGIVATVLKA